MYRYIINPQTNRRVRIDGKIGRQVLKQYLKQSGGQNGSTTRSLTVTPPEIAEHIIRVDSADIPPPPPPIFLRRADSKDELRDPGIGGRNILLDSNYVTSRNCETFIGNNIYVMRDLRMGTQGKTGIIQSCEPELVTVKFPSDPRIYSYILRDRDQYEFEMDIAHYRDLPILTVIEE